MFKSYGYTFINTQKQEAENTKEKILPKIILRFIENFNQKSSSNEIFGPILFTH
jgi:hypothetical protein